MMMIVYNDFESGLLAPKAGVVSLADLPTGDPFDEQALISKAFAANYSFLTLRAVSPLRTHHFRYMGRLITLFCDFQTATQRIFSYRNPSHVLPMVDTHWDSIERLLPHSSNTRFSLDPHIPTSIVYRHKRKCIETYLSETPRLAHVIVDKHGEVIAFFCSFVRSATLHFYELLVHRDYLRGYLGIGLLQANLTLLAAFDLSINTIQTRVYEDNTQSLSFFRGLGMEETESCHYYHYWNLP